jgi:hypothetical protein
MDFETKFLLFLGLPSILFLIWIFFKDKKSRRLKTDYLRSIGFQDCPTRANELKAKARRIACMDNADFSEKQFSVSNPVCITSGEEEIFHFFFTQIIGGSRYRTAIAQEVFLFPFQRNTGDAVALFLHPMDVKGMKRKIGAYVTGVREARGMDELQMPRELQDGHLMAVFGKPNGSKTLYELVDQATISTLLSGVQYGVAAFQARDNLAMLSMSCLSWGKPEALKPLWPFVQGVAGMR